MGISLEKKKKELMWSTLMAVLGSIFVAARIFNDRRKSKSAKASHLLSAPVTFLSAGVLHEATKNPSLETSNVGCHYCFWQTCWGK